MARRRTVLREQLWLLAGLSATGHQAPPCLAPQDLRVGVGHSYTDAANEASFQDSSHADSGMTAIGSSQIAHSWIYVPERSDAARSGERFDKGATLPRPFPQLQLQEGMDMSKTLGLRRKARLASVACTACAALVVAAVIPSAAFAFGEGYGGGQLCGSNCLIQSAGAHTFNFNEGGSLTGTPELACQLFNSSGANEVTHGMATAPLYFGGDIRVGSRLQPERRHLQRGRLCGNVTSPTNPSVHSHAERTHYEQDASTQGVDGRWRTGSRHCLWRSRSLRRHGGTSKAPVPGNRLATVPPGPERLLRANGLNASNAVPVFSLANGDSVGLLTGTNTKCLVRTSMAMWRENPAPTPLGSSRVKGSP